MRFAHASDVLTLEAPVFDNLKFIAARTWSFSDRAKNDISTSVLVLLASYGIGISDGGGLTRPIETLADVMRTPAVACILGELNEEARKSSIWKKQAKQMSQSTKVFFSALDTNDALFMVTFGLTLLVWVRNFEAHVWTSPPSVARAGLTGAVVAQAVDAAIAALIKAQGADFAVGADGVLCLTAKLPGADGRPA